MKSKATLRSPSAFGAAFSRLGRTSLNFRTIQTLRWRASSFGQWKGHLLVRLISGFEGYESQGRRIDTSKSPFLLMVFAGLCSVSSAAHADWADLGVSWRCDEAANTFSIRPIVDTSSGEKVALQPGFNKVVDGFHNKPPYTTTLQCNLPGAKVKAVVHAKGDTYQLSLWVNKTTVFENALFNSGLGFAPVPYQVEVTSHGRASYPSITVCLGNWSWDKNYDEGVCKALDKP